MYLTLLLLIIILYVIINNNKNKVVMLSISLFSTLDYTKISSNTNNLFYCPEVPWMFSRSDILQKLPNSSWNATFDIPVRVYTFMEPTKINFSHKYECTESSAAST